MSPEKDNFGSSGANQLTAVDWSNERHHRCVSACLVNSVYVQERDRPKNRNGSAASLAPPWWEFFGFELIRQLIDNDDQSIFGAIFEYRVPPPYCGHKSMEKAPKYVIAFRGTLLKPDSYKRDLKLDSVVILNKLNRYSRFEIAMEAVVNVVDLGGSNLKIWLAGHSLGASIALLAGKTMASNLGIFLQAFLFNPPYISAPIEMIQNQKMKDMFRAADSCLTAILAVTMKNHGQRSASKESFAQLSAWRPSLFVNLEDPFCKGFAGYYEKREKMEEIGLKKIAKLATMNSKSSLYFCRKDSENLRLLPSAYLVTNGSSSTGSKEGRKSPCSFLKRVHGIEQWWDPYKNLPSKLYQYQ
ncbi:GDSL esterase/lipase At4g10955-like [Macadamia integrifolia]|uniref:GDSL esterase/lipase At4g10955-like n=1 Tax=Macadamia integrifolia TaxID=60698 RepID=UPI001C4F6AEB|nr:GDSL esterase/lipase At4g10955-like [Macadamia integrifolia]